MDKASFSQYSRLVDEATHNADADLVGSVFQLAFKAEDTPPPFGFIQSGFMAPHHISAEDHGKVLMPDNRGPGWSEMGGGRRGRGGINICGYWSVPDLFSTGCVCEPIIFAGEMFGDFEEALFRTSGGIKRPMGLNEVFTPDVHF